MTKGAELPIKDALLISTPVFVDDRGSFEVSWESYDPFFKERSFAPLSLQHSYNPVKGTLRGLHFQRKPHGQNKLVTCVSGCVCCLLYTSPSPRDKRQSRMPSSA